MADVSGIALVRHSDANAYPFFTLHPFYIRIGWHCAVTLPSDLNIQFDVSAVNAIPLFTHRAVIQAASKTRYRCLYLGRIKHVSHSRTVPH